MTGTDDSGVTVVVNGEALVTRARSLAELVAELGLGDARVATAVNGDFVPERSRAEQLLRERDAIEVVSPRQGG